MPNNSEIFQNTFIRSIRSDAKALVVHSPCARAVERDLASRQHEHQTKNIQKNACFLMYFWIFSKTLSSLCLFWDTTFCLGSPGRRQLAVELLCTGLSGHHRGGLTPRKGDRSPKNKYFGVFPDPQIRCAFNSPEQPVEDSRKKLLRN